MLRGHGVPVPTVMAGWPRKLLGSRENLIGGIVACFVVFQA